VDRDRRELSAPRFWEELYRSGGDAWDLGGPAPALAAWLEAGGRFEPRAEVAPRVAVPGCGRGHDARLLARHGARAWGFDFAAPALAAARALAEREGLDVTWAARDVFALAPEYAEFFDGVWEYTCFCAIDPGRRREYARVLRDVLRPGGALLACFFPLREGGDGPPFPVSAAEIADVLAPHFDVLEAAPPARSPEPRQGLELLVRAVRRR
jgi:SAM-dependent methyltransferase